MRCSPVSGCRTSSQDKREPKCRQGAREPSSPTGPKLDFTGKVNEMKSKVEVKHREGFRDFRPFQRKSKIVDWNLMKSIVGILSGLVDFSNNTFCF